jgi:hypothetical protein
LFFTKIPTATPDIESCELVHSCIIDGNSSGSLLPILSMMQAADAVK